MTDSHTRWEIVQELFHRVLEVEPAERDQLLDTLCDDASVRAEVRSLLQHDAAIGSMLDRDVAEACWPGRAERTDQCGERQRQERQRYGDERAAGEQRRVSDQVIHVRRPPSGRPHLFAISRHRC